MSETVPHAMYQAVSDMLTEALRREIPLRAEVIALNAEIARLNSELANVFEARGPHEQADAVVFNFGREAV